MRLIKHIACYSLIGILILLNQNSYASDSIPIIENGYVDLSEYDFEKMGNFHLNGQWKFFWQEFLSLDQIESNIEYSLLEVPKNWKNQTHKDILLPADGYGTYYLKIIINKKYRNDIFLLKTRYIPNASKIYINNKLVGSGGEIGNTKETMVPSLDIDLNEFIIHNDTLNIVVHASNFQLYKGGLYYEIELGKSKTISHSISSNNAKIFFILGTIFLMILYYLILFILRRKERSSLYFSMLCFWIAAYTLCLSDLYYSILPFTNFAFDFKLKHISIYFALLSMSLYIYNLYRIEFKKIVLKIILAICLVGIVSMIILNTKINSYLFDYFRWFGVLVTMFIIYVIIRAKIKKREGASIFIIGLLIILIAVINDSLLSKGIISSIDLLPVAMFLFLFLQTFLLSSRFTKSFAKTEELTEELTYINKNLEGIVEERTHEISMQKHEIEEKNEELKQLVEEVTSQRDEIEAQRDLVTEQKEHIEEIHNEVSQSIDYATRLQSAILPDPEILKKITTDHFVLFQPKDKVSGDFFWWAHVEDHTVITAADCTGHGVPGAFMSMLGISFLREIVLKEYITHPGVVLRRLRKEIIKSLKQRGVSGEQKDGMDMALIAINHETNMLQFAGANNPLYLIRNGEFTEYKPDKMPIAIYDRMDNYTVQEIQLISGDQLYLFSDGYPDQFGGPKGKKFMYKRFKELLTEISSKSMYEQKSILEKEFNNWKGETEQIDDVVVLGIKI